jgi:hypothetical protein
VSGSMCPAFITVPRPARDHGRDPIGKEQALGGGQVGILDKILGGGGDKEPGDMSPAEFNAWRQQKRSERVADAKRLRAEAVQQGRDDLVKEIDEKLLFDADSN